ncbi:SPOR domain-containing protein [Candidatus Kapabacteria bacterium]|nr:SPOR domain-containing protein [Candidatus Kapabacteria bacterium]
MRKLAALFLLPCIMLAKDLQIGKYLNMVAEGKTDEVRSVMLDLYVESPNDPGVMLLAGAVLQDAFKAMDFYQKIVQEHPNSEWADDALWRIIQFYAILGDEKRANSSLAVMRQKYPTSQLIVPATDVVRSAVGLASYKKQNELKLPNLDISEKRSDIIEEPKETKKDVFADNSLEMGKDETQIVQESKAEQPRKKTAQDLLKQQQEILKNQPVSNDLEVEDKQAEMPKTSQKKDLAFNELIKDEQAATKTNTQISYGLQVASFASRDLAEQEQQKFLAQRMRTEISPVTIDGSTQFAVVIGAYSSKRSAEAAKIIVSRQCSCNPVVIEKY